MPDKTKDIQEAISIVVGPGEELTLPQLNERLFDSFPQLREIQMTWIGIAVTRMLKDGRLVSPDGDAPFSERYRIRRPAFAA